MSESEKRGTPPGYWIVAGLIVIVLGLVLDAASDGPQVAQIALWLGGAMILYGIIVKVIAAGVRASRD